ncbi:MAG: HAD family acid phosphatase [Vicinamibacterales bacterium]
MVPHSAVRPFNRSSLFVVFVALSLAGCGARTAPAPATPQPPKPTAAPATSTLPDSIRWVRGSAEFVAAYEQTYRLATTRVEAEARTRTAGAWGVILDADETVLDNSLFEEERARIGQTYSEESWEAWVRRQEATPLPGAAAFLARVRALGGRIAIVTNRMQPLCPDTEVVLRKYQLAYDAILCRVPGTPSDKNPRFEAVASGRSPASATPLEIVAFVGDNIQDFPKLAQSIRTQGSSAFAEFGVRYFLLPNPMYGSWQ